MSKDKIFILDIFTPVRHTANLFVGKPLNDNTFCHPLIKNPHLVYIKSKFSQEQLDNNSFTKLSPSEHFNEWIYNITCKIISQRL